MWSSVALIVVATTATVRFATAFSSSSAAAVASPAPLFFSTSSFRDRATSLFAAIDGDNEENNDETKRQDGVEWLREAMGEDAAVAETATTVPARTGLAGFAVDREMGFVAVLGFSTSYDDDDDDDADAVRYACAVVNREDTSFLRSPEALTLVQLAGGMDLGTAVLPPDALARVVAEDDDNDDDDDNESSVERGGVELVGVTAVLRGPEGSSVASNDEDEDDEDDVVASRRARVAGALSSLASSLVDAPRRLLSRGGDGDDVVGVPMEFPNEGGWGVATLAAATPLGESNYARYEMALPRPDHSLAAALRMGQRLELCCLDEDGAVSKGAFHPCSDVRRELGKVSFVARRDAVPTTATSAEDDDDDKDRFARVLQHHLAVGDEVALRPAPGDEDDGALSYRGPHLPVTDMVYVARADGVVPVARQIAAVLPAGSSSVRSVTVLWLNDDPRDFLDVVYDELERLHGRHRDRLEVSCVVTSLDSVFDGDDPEVRDAVPVYRPGGMAVVAGPPAFRERVSEWLRTGPPSWPEDCLCVLP